MDKFVLKQIVVTEKCDGLVVTFKIEKLWFESYPTSLVKTMKAVAS